MELEEELMFHSPDFFSPEDSIVLIFIKTTRVRLFCMALVEQLEYGLQVVCAAQLLPCGTGVMRHLI